MDVTGLISSDSISDSCNPAQLNFGSACANCHPGAYWNGKLCNPCPQGSAFLKGVFAFILLLFLFGLAYFSTLPETTLAAEDIRFKVLLFKATAAFGIGFANIQLCWLLGSICSTRFDEVNMTGVNLLRYAMFLTKRGKPGLELRSFFKA